MATGAIYAGFPGPVDKYGMFNVWGACSLAYIASENRYDIRGVMTATHPLELNLSCVQVRQELVDDTDSALAYCRYLGTLVATMEDQNQVMPEIFNEYIDYINPYFISQCEGMDLRLIGRYDYAMYSDDVVKAKDYQQQMARVKREFKEKTLTVEEKSCQPKVVHLQFGSKSNASEKGED
jgi:hypothetical protein